MNPYQAATTAMREEFEVFLAGCGDLCTWKPRSSVTPSTTSAISTAYGRGDPNDEAWVREIEDPAVYPTTTQRTIRVRRDIPTTSQAEAAGQMVTGTTIARTSLDNAVGIGDVLVFAEGSDSVAWYVDGARDVSGVYRELTIRRGGTVDA